MCPRDTSSTFARTLNRSLTRWLIRAAPIALIAVLELRVIVFGRVNPEAEHHPALVMLGDVTVRHPKSRVGYVEQDVDGSPVRTEHGSFQTRLAFCLAISRENDEPSGAMDVERVMHRVV